MTTLAPAAPILRAGDGTIIEIGGLYAWDWMTGIGRGKEVKRPRAVRVMGIEEIEGDAPVLDIVEVERIGAHPGTSNGRTHRARYNSAVFVKRWPGEPLPSEAAAQKLLDDAAAAEAQRIKNEAAAALHAAMRAAGTTRAGLALEGVDAE